MSKTTVTAIAIISLTKRRVEQDVHRLTPESSSLTTGCAGYRYVDVYTFYVPDFEGKWTFDTLQGLMSFVDVCSLPSKVIIGKQNRRTYAHTRLVIRARLYYSPVGVPVVRV